MNATDTRLALLSMRRTMLVARSAVLRQSLLDEAANWQVPLARAERALEAFAWARAHLHWVIGAALALTATGRLGVWVRRGWRVITLWRRLRRDERALLSS
jgi:hypothetical protein